MVSSAFTRTRFFLLSLTALALSASGSLRATSSGLNNIPTADTISHRTVAVQAFDTFGSGPHDFWMGFKTGLEFGPLDFEWGLDSHLAPDPEGPLYFQTKVGVQPWQGGKVAVGVANVAFTDSDRAGDPFTYAVVTHDFGIARLSLGYGLQEDNNTVLIGVDRTWKVLERNLNLNADLVQTNDESNWLASVGVKSDLTDFLVFETWANLPDEGDVSFVAKLNVVFKF